jgi:hypothetical protein
LPISAAVSANSPSERSYDNSTCFALSVIGWRQKNDWRPGCDEKDAGAEKLLAHSDFKFMYEESARRLQAGKG